MQNNGDERRREGDARRRGAQEQAQDRMEPRRSAGNGYEQSARQVSGARGAGSAYDAPAERARAQRYGGPQDGGYAAPVRGPQDGGYTAPVRGPQDGGYAAPVRGPQDGGYTAPVRGPQDGGYTAPVRGPRSYSTQPPRAGMPRYNDNARSGRRYAPAQGEAANASSGRQMPRAGAPDGAGKRPGAGRRSRRISIAVCALCLLLIGVIGAYYLTDYLDWAKINNYPLKYEDLIDRYSQEYQLDPALVCAVIYAESGFDPKAVSVDGARGVMQIMPDTGDWIAGKLDMDDYDVDMLFEPEVNIRFGCWMLNYLYGRFSGDAKKTLAAYNAGQGNVDKWMKDPGCSKDGLTLDYIPFKETRNYVKKVMAAHDIYLERYYSSRAAA
jgi:soluble lytic murein transglycosylase